MISVLVPIFNAEKYIRRCLNSITQQTYQEIEILLMNDGSEDHSLEICNEYAQKDNRVRVLDKSNEGVGMTRYRLINEAKGEFFFFIDADDYLDTHALEILICLNGSNTTSCLQSFPVYRRCME